jgi:hypothetical protein
MGLLVYKKYTLKGTDSRFAAYRAFGAFWGAKIRVWVREGCAGASLVFWLLDVVGYMRYEERCVCIGTQDLARGTPPPWPPRPKSQNFLWKIFHFLNVNMGALGASNKHPSIINTTVHYDDSDDGLSTLCPHCRSSFFLRLDSSSLCGYSFLLCTYARFLLCLRGSSRSSFTN